MDPHLSGAMTLHDKSKEAGIVLKPHFERAGGKVAWSVWN